MTATAGPDHPDHPDRLGRADPCDRSGRLVRPARHVRRGFTLIELLTAMTISGILVLLTHQVFASVTEGGTRLDRATAALEQERLGERWLASAFLSLEVADSGGGFEGHADRVAFSTWLMVPGGWMERCRVRLGLTEAALTANGCGRTEVLRVALDSVVFDYLLEPGAQSHWVSDWVSPVSAPLAVRLRTVGQLAVDTLLFLIKGRG